MFENAKTGRVAHDEPLRIAVYSGADCGFGVVSDSGLDSEGEAVDCVAVVRGE